MKFAIIFSILCGICFLAYLFLIALMTSTPAIALFLTIPMIITGWGAGAFFIIAIVCFIIKR